MKNKLIYMLCVLCIIFASLASAFDDFVKVNGTQFYLDGKPFYFAGTNAYYLWYGDTDCSSPGANQGCVIPLLNDAKSLNLSVIRTWGSSEGTSKYGFCFQPSAGSYDEATFAHFDRVIKEASDRNLKLIITLVNNWGDFGGMNTYNSWCGLVNHDDFYTSACTKTLYKNYVSYFINRMNTITGIKYKDDPAILAWELANEPRCASDKTGATLNNWIGEMSAYIKSIDTNHLVTTGVDGGYVDKGSDPWAWWYKGNEGQDYYSNHNWNTIDFATFHYYQDMDTSINVNTWIQEHIDDAHNVIGKPVLFEEFNNITNKEIILQDWYNQMESYGVDGDTFWMLADDNFMGNNDGYFVQCPEDAGICNLIRNHALYMHNKSKLFVNLSIDLEDGWNLISIPLVLEDNSVANVFLGIAYSSLFFYDNGWKVPTSIAPNKGYWIKVDGNPTMNIGGNPIENPDFNSGAEWDLVGYPYLEKRDISELLVNATVYMYNNSEWYSYGPNKPSNTLTKFTPSYGYWVKSP